MVFIALVFSLAHAGWWSNVCERAFDSIIAEDPYQFEDAPSDILFSHLKRLEVREAWGKLDKSERIHIKLIRNELQARALERLIVSP